MLIALFVSIVILVLLAAIQPERSAMSSFELSRLEAVGDRLVRKNLQREQLMVYVVSLRNIFVAIMLIVVTLLSVLALGRPLGIAVAIIVSLEYGFLSRLNLSRNLSQKIYGRSETDILRFIAKHKKYLRLLRSVNLTDINHEYTISSRDELSKLVSESLSILTPHERLLIVNSLTFADKLVSSVMTPRGAINSIKKSEFLGPVTLTELHQIGHSRLPVINGDIDHVVGILYLKDLLNLEDKKSTTAEKAMEQKVYYIKDNQTLEQALAAFLKTHHHMFVVINEHRETVGLITIEDVIEALIGRKIIDEFDMHTDPRAVARRNQDINNSPKHAVDV